jgi:hypothetical protein
VLFFAPDASIAGHVRREHAVQAKITKGIDVAGSERQRQQ